MLPTVMLYAKAFYHSIIGALRENLLIYGGYAAYTSILALFPFIIFLVALSSVFGDARLAEEVINYGFDIMPPEVVNTVAPVIRDIMQSNDTTVLGFAALGTLWVASSGIEGLRFGLNAVYGVPEPRPLWKRRLQGLWFVLACSVAFLILATALIAWPVIEKFLGDYFPILDSKALAVVRYGSSFLLLATGMSQMYYFLPNVKQKWRQTYPGAFLATVMWIALASLFSLYVSNFGDYTLRYGSIAGVIITLVFLHFSAAILLFGAQFNASLKKLRGELAAAIS